jgi:hypothetical protein
MKYRLNALNGLLSLAGCGWERYWRLMRARVESSRIDVSKSIKKNGERMAQNGSLGWGNDWNAKRRRSVKKNKSNLERLRKDREEEQRLIKEEQRSRRRTKIEKRSRKCNNNGRISRIELYPTTP